MQRSIKCIWIILFLTLDKGYSSEENDRLNPSPCNNIFSELPNKSYAIRKKIGVVTSLMPFKIKCGCDELEFEVDKELVTEDLVNVKVGDRLDTTVEFDRKAFKIVRILTLKLLPKLMDRPYDDGQLRREMSELPRINPEDI